MAVVRTRRIIDDAGAQSVLAAAEREAVAQELRVVIAVVDPWGELVALRRTPGAQAASSRVAVDKARTAAIFVRPSREMEEQVTAGRFGALALNGASCLIGGIPLVVDGESLVPLAPLALPPADADLDAAQRAAAVRLFAERAAAVAPEFDIVEVWSLTDTECDDELMLTAIE